RTLHLATPALHDALPIFEVDGLAIDVAGGVLRAEPAEVSVRDRQYTDVERPLERHGAQTLVRPSSLLAPLAAHLEGAGRHEPERSEEHTSELQSPDHLVC